MLYCNDEITPHGLVCLLYTSQGQYPIPLMASQVYQTLYIRMCVRILHMYCIHLQVERGVYMYQCFLDLPIS